MYPKEIHGEIVCGVRLDLKVDTMVFGDGKDDEGKQWKKEGTHKLENIVTIQLQLCTFI